MRVSVAGRVGVGAGLATVACYAPGIGRPYGWDASNTVGTDGRRPMVVAYVAFAAIGVASHLYMLTVLVAHAAFVSARPGELRRWAPRWVLAVVAGLAPAAVPLAEALFRHQYRFFDAVFPVRFTFDLLGGEGVAFVVLAPLAAVGAWRLRDRVPLRRAAIAVAALVVGSWLASPEFLYSRFYLWLLPGIAVAVASVVARRPALGWVVAIALGAQVVTQLPGLGDAQVPNRTAGALVARAQRAGLRTCAIGPTGTTLAAY